MKSTNYPSTNVTNTSNHNSASHPCPGEAGAPKASKWGPKPSIPPNIRTRSREHVNPVDYQHPYDSMARFADLLALRYDANRTRHAYYRHLRLIHQHFNCDPVDHPQQQGAQGSGPAAAHLHVAGTFTLPSELRACFFGPLAKQAYDLFFAAVSNSLAEKLAADKGLRAHVNGCIAALHTWNQRMEFHPHIHCLVPGAGLNARGKPVRVKNAQFLVYLPHLQAAFRQRMRQLMEDNGWQADPAIWTKDWGVHIQPAGSGVSALKYLAAYVARTAITDARILQLNHDAVTFRWKDRSDGNRQRTSTVPGIEFVRRYLRHVLPARLRSVRYYGFCHPAAKANRMRVQFHTGIPVPFGAAAQAQTPDAGSCPSCPKCGGPTRFILRIHSPWRKRGPPSGKRPNPADCQAASTSRAA